jgi:exonuclease VII large subunit
VIRDASSVAVGDTVTVTVQRGELSCEVKDRRP